MVFDLLRIISAAWVAIYHYSGGHGFFTFLSHPYVNLLKTPELGVANQVVRLGFLAVPIFFVISGFVIYKSSLQKSGKDFVISRVSRLLPGYVFSILITILLWNYEFTGEHSVNLSNIFSSISFSWETFNTSGIQGSYWTLIPEIKFYLIFYLLAFQLIPRFSRKKVNHFSILIIWLSIMYISSSSQLTSIIFIRQFSIYFLLGMVIAHIKESGVQISNLILIVIVLGFCSSTLIYWINGENFIQKNDWRLGILIFYIATLLMFFSDKITIKNKKINDIFKILGRSTYVFYLLQESLGFAVITYFINSGLRISISIFIGFFIVCVVSVWFTVSIEERLINYIKQKLHKEFP
jgi:peptidoglycan/LPS O-acetylase OafA/YrhL